MDIEKRTIPRAFEEINESIKNVLNARLEDYLLRVMQLFSTINKNKVLNLIISPYLDLNVDDEYGISRNRQHRMQYKIPVDDDQEIALALQLLYEIKDDERSVYNLPHEIYRTTNLNEGLCLFNENIIHPAMNKLLRKIRYKVEDLELIGDEKIDSGKVTIINIGDITAHNSSVAVGSNITQNSDDHQTFNDLRKILTEKVIDEKTKSSLIQLVEQMEADKENKDKYQASYNAFITKLGTYMTIVSPFIPYLVSWLPK